MKEMLVEESGNVALYFKNGNGRMINVAKAEIFAGVPKHTITNVLAIGRPLPLKHVRKVVETLERVGYEPIYIWNLEVTVNNKINNKN